MDFTTGLKMRVAIIDIGTNTFNLLISEITDGRIHFLFSKKIGVRLGRGSTLNGYLQDDAIERSIETLDLFQNLIQEYSVEKIFVYATSAVRSAKNGPIFCDLLFKRYGFTVEVISGDEEAELIYLGVKQAYPISPDMPIVIIDIGGGSTELILVNQSGVVWKKSYQIGVTRLFEQFKPADPILLQQIEEIKQYVSDMFSDFIKLIKDFTSFVLIGSSGAFDSFVDLIYHDRLQEEHPYNRTYRIIDLPEFNKMGKTLLASTLNERMNMKYLVPIRAETIPMAVLITQVIIENSPVASLVQSEYSLKEGAVLRVIEKK